VNKNNQLHICLVLDQILQHYRTPLFKRLVDRGYKLTIYYPEHFKKKSKTLEELDGELANSVHAVPHKFDSYFGLFYMGIKHLNQYDLVIFMQDLRVIDFWKATLNPFKTYKLFHWGIGVSSFDRKNWLTGPARNMLAGFADSLILYSDRAKKYYRPGIQNKIAVAHNTVENLHSEDFSGSEKDSFLFIGQLDKRKGLPELMLAFSDYLQDIDGSDIQNLVIIGDGEMRDKLQKLTEKLEITDSVIFAGTVKEDKQKREYFKRAQLCISMNQAGLAVLESFSYGVPFVTTRKAITGGERFNIQHKKTGFFVESVRDLTDLFHYSQKNRREMKRIGADAYQFYHEKRSMNKMAGVFDEVIQRVINRDL